VHAFRAAHIGKPRDPGKRGSLGEEGSGALAARLVPEGDPFYTHDTEGPDDMPAHIRAALTATSLSIPVAERALALGAWQGIYLWEHRRRGSRRDLVLHLY